MSKRDEQRRQADLDFEEIRQSVAAQSDEWLCDALREIPHRKWIETEKDCHVAVGILAHRSAERIVELTNEVESLNETMERQRQRLERVRDAAFKYWFNYLQDESEDRTVCHSDEQYELAKELRDSLAAAISVQAQALASVLAKSRGL